MKAFLQTLTLLFCAATLWAADSNLIKIGVILPLTGDNAGLGQPQLAAIRLFQKECAEGKYKHKYELIIEDNQLAARPSAEAANKLLNIDHVDGLVSLFCDAGNVLAPRIRAAGIPHINCVCSDDKVAEGQFNFVHWPQPAKESSAFVGLIQKLGGRNVAFLCARQPGCLALLRWTESEMKKRDIAFTTELFNPGERDFRTVLTKLRLKNPDMLVPIAFTPEMEIILRQMKQLDFKPRVTTMECFDFTADLTDAEGLYYLSGGNPTADFDKKLVALTGKGSSYGVPTIYDGLNLIRSAYERMDKPDHLKAAEWLRSVKDYPSAMGKISVTKGGRIDSELGYYKIVGGKPVSVKFDEIK